MRLGSLGILYEESLRALDRTPTKHNGWLARLNRSLMASVAPQNKEIRGVAIAGYSLVRALALHSEAEHVDLYLDPAYLSSVEEITQAYQDVTTPPGKIRGKLLGNQQGLAREDIPPAAWLNLSPFQSRMGGIERSHTFRRLNTPARYPIATLFHGLSIHSMLYTCFLRAILCDSLACDSLITTSKASEIAIKSLMEGVQYSLQADFGALIPYKGRYDTIPLPVDTAKYRPYDKQVCRKKLKLSRNSFVLLYVGRLSVLKADLSPFISVLSNLVKKNPTREILWIIAGTEEDEYTTQLVKTSQSLGISQQLKILLNISDDTKRDLLSAADVFFSPSDSLQESFGLAPLEAMASGLPQVVADWSGYRDTVVHGVTGFLIPTHWGYCDQDLEGTASLMGWQYDHLRLGQSVAVDPGKTEEYLQILLTHPELLYQMSADSRERAERLYSERAIARQYDLLWTELQDISQRSSIPNTTSKFDQPNYVRSFKHYASSWLDDEREIHLTVSGDLAAANQKNLLVEAKVPTGLLDESLLRSVLESMRSISYAQQDDPITSHLMIALVSQGRTYSESVYWRHLLWLIKYGYIAVSKSSYLT